MEPGIDGLTPAGAAALAAPFSAAPLSVESRPRLLQVYALLYELFCLSVAMLATVVIPQMATHQFSLAGVLAMRVSVVNIITASFMVGVWGSLLPIMTVKRRDDSTVHKTAGFIMLRVAGCSALALLVILIRRPIMADLGHLLNFFCISFVLLFSGELIIRIYHVFVRSSIRKERTALIVGSGWRGQQLALKLQVHPSWTYRMVGFVDSAPPTDSGPVIGAVDELESLLMSHPVDEVLITLPVKSMYDDIQRTIAICERVGVQCSYSADLFHTRIIKSRTVYHDDPSRVMHLHTARAGATQGVKRAIDILVAACGLLCLLPVLAGISLAIKLTSDGPVLFRQKRYGLNKHLFTIYKFRTMVVQAEQQQAMLEHLNENDGPAFKIRKDPRVIKVGSFLRRTSLDELPQLWNVLIGDMSLVGPRPLPVRDVSRFSEGWLMRRFSVPPGITGLWQVSGRSNLSFSNWITMDLDYIDRWSLMLDLEILARTFPAVLKRDGAA